MKIDIHNHILPENWPDLKAKYGYDGWVQLDHKRCSEPGKADMMRNGRFFRRVDSNCWDLKQRIEDMNRDGITLQALSTVPIMFNYWARPQDTLDFSRFLNDDLTAKVQKYPKRFVALGTLPLQAPKYALEEMKRCVRDLKMPGFQIGSHVGEWNLDSPELYPIYKTAEDLDACLFVHPWDMEMGGRHTNYWLPWLVGMPAETATAMVSLLMGGILDKFPRLKICFAHGGGSFPYILGRINHGYIVRPDLCANNSKLSPREYIGKIYTDSLVHDPCALELLVKTMGEDCVILGTDYPFPLGEVRSFGSAYPGQVIEEASGLRENVKEKLRYGNALGFLGLNERDYSN